MTCIYHRFMSKNDLKEIRTEAGAPKEATTFSWQRACDSSITLLAISTKISTETDCWKTSLQALLP